MNQPNEGLDYRPLELMRDPKITKFEFDDFIGVWENFMPPGVCDEIIAYAERNFETGSIIYSMEDMNDYTEDDETIYESADVYGGELNRKDYAFLMNYHNRKLTTAINSILRSCAKHYVNKYQSLMNISMISTDIKLQKTPPGGGYHLWHCENGLLTHSARELVWMIYLNDMPDGEAETEFMYQRRRIKPTKGTVVMWPAGFTHTHKGNTVLTQDKYIITGWYIKSK